jgi:AbrB family looped-hinge helix DNA binding protein
MVLASSMSKLVQALLTPDRRKGERGCSRRASLHHRSKSVLLEIENTKEPFISASGDVMPLVKVRRAAQITLPAEVRDALRVSEGDYLEAELVEGGVLFRPVAIVSRDRAWRDIEDAMASVRPTPEQAAKPLDEQEREIEEVVSEARREHAQELRRR